MRTVQNEKVSLFLLNEELENRWFWQLEIDAINRWAESSGPGDVIVLNGIIAEECGMQEYARHLFLVALARHEIKQRLPRLGLTQLRRLSSMVLCVETHQRAA